jgi:hypothetical protein
MGLAAAQTSSVGPQQPSNSAPDLQTIVDRLEHAQAENRTSFHPYTVTRDYQLFGSEPQPQSTVIAQVTFLPPDSKHYEIRQTSGSGQGEKVVRKVLDHEKEMAKDDSGEHDLSRKNYDFALVGERDLNGVRCYLLQIHPKRADKNLIEGTAWIDAQTFMPRKIAGTPSKSPSWWVKNLKLEMSYGPVAGMWLPIGSRAEADVRIVGRHTFVARDVRYERLETIAQNRKVRPRRPTAVVPGVGIIVPE